MRTPPHRRRRCLRPSRGGWSPPTLPPGFSFVAADTPAAVATLRAAPGGGGTAAAAGGSGADAVVDRFWDEPRPPPWSDRGVDAMVLATADRSASGARGRCSSASGGSLLGSDPLPSAARQRVNRLSQDRRAA